MDKHTSRDCSRSGWFDVSHGGLAPPTVPGSEFTYEVLVAISCDNGRRFMDIDRYDTLADGWEKYDEQDGRRVVAWKQLPRFPSWVLSSDSPVRARSDKGAES